MKPNETPKHLTLSSGKSSKTSLIGTLGEQWLQEYLIQRDWTILHHQWRCRWGEIDCIAQHPQESLLAFIEIKTRQPRNWDNGGLLSITPQKQRKISKTAQYFLEQYPQFADFILRFDVALICYTIQRETPYFILENYLESAFDLYDE